MRICISAWSLCDAHAKVWVGRHTVKINSLKAETKTQLASSFSKKVKSLFPLILCHLSSLQEAGKSLGSFLAHCSVQQAWLSKWRPRFKLGGKAKEGGVERPKPSYRLYQPGYVKNRSHSATGMTKIRGWHRLEKGWGSKVKEATIIHFTCNTKGEALLNFTRSCCEPQDPQGNLYPSLHLKQQSQWLPKFQLRVAFNLAFVQGLDIKLPPKN